MRNRARYWHILLASMVLALLVTACYQQVGDEIQPTQISQSLPTDTPTPEPTLTETPTPTPTETPDLDQPIADLSTDTPTPTEAVSVAQGDQVEDPFVLTATVIVLEITQTVEAQFTMTAEALGIGATDTPFVFATETPTLSAIATSGPSFGGADCVHEVVAGENLFRLSLRYGVSVNDLARVSGITNPQLIVVGQRVVVPGCGTTGVFPPPTSIPTGTTSEFGTGGPVTSQAVGGRTHVVQQYESLFQISLIYGVPVQSIANANGITNINLIIMGQQLVIPAQ